MTTEANNGFYRGHKWLGIMEAGYTEKKTTKHFTSSFEGNYVHIALQGGPFSSNSVCGSPISLTVSFIML